MEEHFYPASRNFNVVIIRYIDNLTNKMQKTWIEMVSKHLCCCGFSWVLQILSYT